MISPSIITDLIALLIAVSDDVASLLALGGITCSASNLSSSFDLNNSFENENFLRSEV